MTDPIRTPAEALEAAAQLHDQRAQDHYDAQGKAAHIDYIRQNAALAEAHAHSAFTIRALASRIAAPDDEALVEMVARIHCQNFEDDWSICKKWHRARARKILSALREAGALR